MSSKKSTLEYVVIGGVLYVGGLLLWNKASQMMNAAPDSMHQSIPNVTQPPPLIRNPQQGNSEWYGYFDQWYNRAGGIPKTEL